jgi:hypothetical protein
MSTNLNGSKPSCTPKKPKRSAKKLNRPKRIFKFTNRKSKLNRCKPESIKLATDFTQSYPELSNIIDDYEDNLEDIKRIRSADIFWVSQDNLKPIPLVKIQNLFSNIEEKKISSKDFVSNCKIVVQIHRRRIMNRKMSKSHSVILRDIQYVQKHLSEATKRLKTLDPIIFDKLSNCKYIFESSLSQTMVSGPTKTSLKYDPIEQFLKLEPILEIYLSLYPVQSNPPQKEYFVLEVLKIWIEAGGRTPKYTESDAFEFVTTMLEATDYNSLDIKKTYLNTLLSFK